ncbi:S24 family peptidase [Stutzerimonas nitrititolerans]|uniref:S24 family peptidase n=1 Tax=Stutzerimonas nitrititolerans TaxID=2482751 RepID=UPI0028A81506|nr:S24 family peptidase [Stutzerimonas nitrititolerans]
MDIYEARIAALAALIGESSLKDFSDRYDITPSHLSQIINGHRRMGERAAANLEAKIGLPPGALVAPSTFSNRAENQPAPHIAGNALPAPAQAGRGRLLPVIGYVRAGEFCEAIDNFQPGDADEWMEAYGPAGPNSFILLVEGHSMDPDFRPGDKVVVDPSAQWENGDYIIAKRARDQAVTLKQIKREGDRHYLYATNPDWPQRIIEMNEEWHICGRVRRKIVEY